MIKGRELKSWRTQRERSISIKDYGLASLTAEMAGKELYKNESFIAYIYIM